MVIRIAGKNSNNSMPYITHQDRSKFSESLESLPQFSTPGELNYALTALCKNYLKDNQTSYQTFNDIVGALECCKQEFYRRLVSPYEDKKIAANGDVFENIECP